MNEMQWSEPHLPHNGGPPTIKNHTVTYHDGLLYCFGGYDGSINHMSLMVYSLERQSWSKVYASVSLDKSTADNNTDTVTTTNHPLSSSPSSSSSSSSFDNDYRVTGTPPPGRNGHTATLATRRVIGTKGRATCIFIIGGWLGTGPLAASDMYILDITDVHSQQSRVNNNCNNATAEQRRTRNAAHWIPVKPAQINGTSPGPCNMHSADFIPGQQEIYLFRGGNGREYLNDLHAFHVDTFTWRVVECKGEAPFRRANHSSAFLVEREELFIFGGWNGKERLNDIHILDTSTSTWSQPHVYGVLPHPRAGMTLTAVRDRLYLFGGSGTSSKCFQDLHVFDRKDMSWLDMVHDSKSKDSSASSQASESLTRDQTTAYTNDNNDNNSNNNNSNNNHNDNNDTNTSRDATHDQHPIEYHRTTNPNQHHPTNTHANPNETESTPTLHLNGKPPGRRAGHTATAVHDRHIYIFGGSCGQDYLNDFFRLDTDPPHLPTTETQPTSLQLIRGRLKYYCNRGGEDDGDGDGRGGDGWEEDDTFADVCFLVEGRRVYGHRMVLSLVSDCYRAMFAKKRGGGGFKESGDGRGCVEIEVPNCSYDAFLMMMFYIYSGEEPKIDIPPLTEAMVVDDGGGFSDSSSSSSNASRSMRIIETVVDLLQLADQYFLDHLKQICERKLQSTVNSYTVECLLQVAQKSNAVQLELVCEHFMRNSAFKTAGSVGL